MKKSVLVTGCSTGIGRYCIEQLKNDGFHVIASARKAQDVQDLKDAGFDAIHLDLDDSQSISLAVQQTLKLTNGKLFALFNNGAYGQPGAVEDLTRDALRKQFETNVFGWLELTNQILPHMKAAGEGRIIQNSSVLGLVAMPFRGAYNSSKFALEGLTDTLRIELRDCPVHVSLIEPGPILSKFRANALKALQENVDIAKSDHAESYKQSIERLSKEGPAAPFTLGPDAVYKRLHHSLTATKPKARYYVTFPTYLFGFLRRILPVSWLDYLLAKG